MGHSHDSGSVGARETKVENEYFGCAGLIGLRHGMYSPTPQRNVHQTAILRSIGASFFFWQMRRGARVHRTGPK